ncbi:MAG: NAD(P)-dependent oxidoreductase [bacterium]
MKILIASPIEPGTISRLQEQHDVVCAFDATTQDLRSLIKDRHLLIFRSGVDITAELMASAPNLTFLIRAGSGLDNVDLEYVGRRGLELARIPGPSAQAVAEMSFAFMLAWSRHLFEADRTMRQGRWAKNDLLGSLLAGRVLGIVGLGNTGTRVAEVGVAWGMDVIGCVEHPSPDRAAEFDEKGIRLTDFDEVISKADYVSVHVPLRDSTYRLINSSVLARMKPGAFLINLGRGGVVDEHALHTALSEGDRLAGAALDVHEEEGEEVSSPLVELPNVILTPHIGATVADTQRQIGCRIQELVDSFAVRFEPEPLASVA